MKSCKSSIDKGSCVPIRIFQFPLNVNKSAHILSNKNSFSKINSSFARQSSLNLIKKNNSENRLSRSYSTKSNEKHRYRTNNCNFIDLGMEDQKLNKPNTQMNPFSSTEIRANKLSDNNCSFSLSIDSVYKNSGIYTPAALIKRPLKIKKIEKSLENSGKDWIVFNTVTLSQPLNKIFISRSTKQIKFNQQTKPKKTLQAWIPQPSNYCKSPFTVYSDSIDQS